MSNLPIRTKLFLTVLLLTVPALIVIASLAYLGGKSAVERTTFERLTSVRAGKARQIEEYFDQIRSQTRILAKNRMVVDAMAEFDAAYEELDALEPTAEQRDAVVAFYREVFLPRLESRSDAGVDIADYLPKDDTEVLLKYNYVAANPHPPGEKDLLDDAGDGSAYSEVH